MDKFSNRVVFNVLLKKRLIFCILAAFLLISTLSFSASREKLNTTLGTNLWNGSLKTHVEKGYKRPGYEIPIANGIPLRIMGLGASTVFGAESFDLTGWRTELREHLVSVGNKVNMVGSQRIGEMVDNDVEAFPGARIDAIYDYSHAVLTKMKPNLVILYAGSNDNFQNAKLPEMFKRYYELVNYVLESSPRVTIVMGTLMPTTETQHWGGQDRVGGMNEQLRRLYQIFKREGKPVVLVEIGDENGVQIENLGPDHMHPSRAGYQIMSRKFFEGILEADARGFLQPAEHVDGIEDDGELGRLDDAYKAKLAEKQRLKEEEDKREEAAIEKMIQELRDSPWDKKPAVPPKKPEKKPEDKKPEEKKPEEKKPEEKKPEEKKEEEKKPEEKKPDAPAP